MHLWFGNSDLLPAISEYEGRNSAEILLGKIFLLHVNKARLFQYLQKRKCYEAIRVMNKLEKQRFKAIMILKTYKTYDIWSTCSLKLPRHTYGGLILWKENIVYDLRQKSNCFIIWHISNNHSDLKLIRKLALVDLVVSSHLTWHVPYFCFIA